MNKYAWEVDSAPHPREGWQVWAGGMRIAATGHASFDRSNAVLIAAAPDLLAAAEKALEANFAADHFEARISLEAAIKKAKGE